jgi:hypothetical protein
MANAMQMEYYFFNLQSLGSQLGTLEMDSEWTEKSYHLDFV